jgi:two-component system, OmpR family, sensor histidine kinase TctE
MPWSSASFGAWAIGLTTSRADGAPSIRRRLLALLIAPTTLVLLAGAASDYISGINPVRDAYDQGLADAALAVAGSVHTDADGRVTAELPPEAITVLRTDAVDAIYFRVSGPDGSFVAGDADLPQTQPASINPSFQNSTYRGQPIRLVSYRSATTPGSVTTVVAETMNKRARVRTRFWSAVLSADLIELLAILAFVWIAVTVALKPLGVLRDQIAGRSARDIKPLSSESVPVEVRALVDGLNRLFETISDSSRAQRQFLESAAHQLRTPLAGVQAQIELLIAEEAHQSKRLRLQLALDATQRLSHTTQQLLALARSEHSVYAHSNFETLDLVTIAQRCVEEHVDRAVASSIDLGAELQPAFVSGVAWLLAEALNNLVDNAMTYTPPGGSVTVRCGTLGEVAFAEVTDSGIGIPAEERDRVKGRFFRGQLSRGAGSGLGLAIVADVARLHHAALTISAGPDDRGTRVRVEFDAMSEDLRS